MKDLMSIADKIQLNGGIISTRDYRYSREYKGKSLKTTNYECSDDCDCHGGDCSDCICTDCQDCGN